MRQSDIETENILYDLESKEEVAQRASIFATIVSVSILCIVIITIIVWGNSYGSLSFTLRMSGMALVPIAIIYYFRYSDYIEIITYVCLTAEVIILTIYNQFFQYDTVTGIIIFYHLPPIFGALILNKPRASMIMGIVTIIVINIKAYHHLQNTVFKTFYLKDSFMESMMFENVVVIVLSLSTTLVVKRVQKAQQSLKARDIMRVREVTAATHDLGNSLQRVQNTISAFFRDIDAITDKYVMEEYKNRFSSAIRGHSAILDDMRDSVLLEYHQLKLFPSPVDIYDVIDSVMSDFELSFEEAQCTYRVSISDDVPLAWCDPGRMRRVFANIIGNALKYTRDHAPTGTGHVLIKVDCQGSFIRCQVVDNGIGIDREKLVELGTPFRRLVEGKNAPSGMGVGLSYCMGIVREGGGELRIDSPGIGQGTTVTICIPIALTDKTSLSEYEYVDETLKEKNILVLEDDLELSQAIKEELSSRGANVTVCSKVEKAKQVLSERNADIVIMDYHVLGIETGSDLAAWMLSDPRYRNIVRVSLSSSSPAEIVKDYPNDLFHKMLSKPIAPDQLVTYVQALLRATPSRREL